MTFRMVLQKFIETIRGKVQRTQNLETEFWRFFRRSKLEDCCSGERMRLIC